MFRKLSNRQLEVLRILWENPAPMIASDIVKSNSDLNINTVQAALKVLIRERYIEVAEIVYSGTVLCRSYRPLISKEQYLADECRSILGNFSSASLVSAFVGDDLEELNELEAMIQKKKKELEEKA